MNGSFNGINSPWTVDHAREQFYREQEEQRRRTEHTERSARWIAGKLVGQEFTSLADLERATVHVVETIQGGPVDEEMAATIKRACVLLFMGLVDRDSMYRRTVERQGDTVRFTAA